MVDQELSFYFNCLAGAFQKVALDTMGTVFTVTDGRPARDQKKFVLIVGIAGRKKGRVLIEINQELALKIFEQINGAPPDNDFDLYLYLAEFANMVSGNGITAINNAIKGIELRLTPPTVFAGDYLEVTSPKIRSFEGSYRSEFGTARLEIGLEGA